MLPKVILIILVILLGLIIVLPFVLSIAGFNIFQFGSVAGGTAVKGDVVIMRSLNGSERWDDVSSTDNAKVRFPKQINQVIFHHSNPETIYLGTMGAALWRSKNGGATWSKMADKSGVLDPAADINKIVLSKSNPNILYLAVYQGKKGRVLRSDNAGDSFTEVYFAPENKVVVGDIYVNPFDSNHVRIINDQGGLLESSNGGKTWRVVRWFTGVLRSLLVNPNDPKDMLLLTGNDLLFKSFDGGANWTDVSQNVSNARFAESGNAPVILRANPFGGIQLGNSIETIVPDPQNFQVVYIGSADGFLRSFSGGYFWEKMHVLIPSDALPVNAVAIHPFNTGTIFVGAGSQIHRSDDGGINWGAKTLPVEKNIKFIFIHPTKPQTMFLVFK